MFVLFLLTHSHAVGARADTPAARTMPVQKVIEARVRVKLPQAAQAVLFPALLERFARARDDKFGAKHEFLVTLLALMARDAYLFVERSDSAAAGEVL